MGVSIVLFAACGGQPFSTGGAAGDSGSGGESAGSGGKSSGTGGSSSKAGTSGKGGSSSGKAGDTSVGGVIGVGGDVSIGGVIGVSGTGMTGEAGAPVGMSCSDPSMCEVSSACVEATCNSGDCGEKNLPDGPFSVQVPGDCKQARCEGGKEVLVADPNDKDDKNVCTKDSCGADGTALHVVQTGQQCANGGTCSATGTCEV